MAKHISLKTWIQAFIIGIFGSLLFKIIEIIIQSISYGQFPYSQIGAYGGNIGFTIFSQLTFLVVISSIFTFILIKLFRRLWVVSFVPILYYLTKEGYNMLFVVHKFYWSNPILESVFAILSIPIGFGVYYLIKKIGGEK